MYELETTSYFRKKYKKLTSKNTELITRVEKTLNQLAKNPKQKRFGVAPTTPRKSR
jgi:mRNA-degrading endonuclease RelE of RelBE toxin-antitoxin system